MDAEQINPGYHLSKKHWNKVLFNGDVNDELILELGDHSCELIVAGLPKKVKEQLKNA